MALTITTARKLEDGSYFYVVEGEDYHREFTWPARPEGVLVADYEAMMVRELTLLAQADTAATQGTIGRKLGAEGEEL